MDDRERAGNVIDVGYDISSIKTGILKALYDESFRKKVKNIKNPYGIGNSSKKIVRILLIMKFLTSIYAILK